MLYDGIDDMTLPECAAPVAFGCAYRALARDAKGFGGGFGQAFAGRWFAGVGAVLAQAGLQLKYELAQLGNVRALKAVLLQHDLLLSQQGLNLPLLPGAVLTQLLVARWTWGGLRDLHGLYCRLGVSSYYYLLLAGMF